MERLFEQRFPIRRIELIDRYGADDHRSMNADNTSAFNCRFVAGTERWSMHAYGKAIDINPIENPYVSGSHVSPPAGEEFADRSRNAEGMIHAGDEVVKAFAREAGLGVGRRLAGVDEGLPALLERRALRAPRRPDLDSLGRARAMPASSADCVTATGSTAACSAAANQSRGAQSGSIGGPRSGSGSGIVNLFCGRTTRSRV